MSAGGGGTVSKALPPGTYNFQITYAGASQQMSRNVATNALVTFQTVQIHSDPPNAYSPLFSFSLTQTVLSAILQALLRSSARGFSPPYEA
jgi:hypothetical protein